MSDVNKIKGKRICAACVGDKYLKGEIRRDGKKAKCAYCGKHAKAMRVEDFAGYIKMAFQDHFEQTSEDFYGHFERQGEPVSFMIQEAALIDEPAAEDVRMVLEDGSGIGCDKDTMHQENPFSEEAHYQSKGVRIAEYLEEWQYFRKSILTEARLFNREAEGVLTRVFEGIENHATASGKTIIVDAGPGKSISALYRARDFQSDDRLEAGISRPDAELGTPPAAAVKHGGRMNAKGIGVFYGATHETVAVAEKRPPVGSRVLVGRFEIIRPLRLLDLEAMQSIEPNGSIFDPSYVRALEKAAFLYTLSARITRPVMPDDEDAEYLVTQAIADYLATRTEPALDGIIYPSAQQGGKLKRNVVLFHKSARVEAIDLPKHTDISAHVTESDEDGTRPDYVVFVKKPPKKLAKPNPMMFPDIFDPYGVVNQDAREPTLRLDVNSLKVHHIEQVKFSVTKFSVRRHEYEMHEDELKKKEGREKEDEIDF